MTANKRSLATARPPTPDALTDLGNAERLAAAHGEDLRYQQAGRSWLVWDGTRWRPDDTGEIHRRAKETVRELYHRARQEPDPDKRQKVAAWAIQSESQYRMTAMVRMAQNEEGMAVVPLHLDRDPWLLTVPNGTIDLSTGDLRPSERGDLITKLAPVAYDPTATAPTWRNFIDRVTGGDDDLARFLQQAAGYSLTGDVSERVLFILYGEGRNGKSTFLEALAAVWGDYAMRTPSETFMRKRSSAIPSDVARLRGARFVYSSETEDGGALNEARVKELTGGDTITARAMHRDWFEYRPEFKLWLATNHKPGIRGTDKAVWDRIRVVPFAVRIPTREEDASQGVDPHLLDKLKAEAPGILAWAVEGCLAWQEHGGLLVPTPVQQAVATYQEESDPIAYFLAEWCNVGASQVAEATPLYEAYADYCEGAGDSPISQKQFGKLLAERGFERGRGRGGRTVWHGLSPIEVAEAPLAVAPALNH